MRKVTASAVILTALTGCSQSSIPSTQWSFEVPTDDQANDATETALTSDRSLSVMPEETRSSVDQSVSGRVMGPAFEQPATEASERASVSTVGRPGSKEVSTLAAEAYGVTSGLTTQPSTRPDPVAQVRAYLRSSGSPSALTNRTPYSSEVYLSSLPTPNRYYEPSISSLNTAFPIGTSGLGLTGDLPAPFSSNAPTISSAISNDTLSGTPDELLTRELTLETAPAVVATFTATESVATESATTDFAARLNNQLPQLEAGLPEANVAATNYADNYIARSPESSRIEAASATPIGTAILQDLQDQDSVSVAVQTEDEGLPRLVSERHTLASGQSPSLPYESETVSITDTFSSSSAATEDVAADAISADSTASERLEADYAYAPVGEAQPMPSLSRLTETMPARDISPLVNSFRSSSNFSPAPESSFLTDAPAAEADFESVRNADAAAIKIPMERTLTEPTIYVPIAEDPERTSSILMQDAADTLNPEVSTADFISNLAAQDAFSSILTSSAFTIEDESLITLTSLSLQASEKRAKQSHLNKAHRSDTVALAAKQISRRRQRLTWM